jgi:hypothetical protein
MDTISDPVTETFEAIHRVAIELLAVHDRHEVERGLDLIASLARYRVDVRPLADR